MRTMALVAMVLLAGFAGVAWGGIINVSLDESGNGLINGQPIAWHIGQDSGPGGLSNALIYTPSPALGFVPGDWVLRDPPGYTEWSDVVRFNVDQTIVFYSDFGDEGDPPYADVGFPTELQLSVLWLAELNVGPFWGQLYQVSSGQVGYIDGATTTYKIISDPTPEPATLTLLAVGGLALISRRRK